MSLGLDLKIPASVFAPFEAEVAVEVTDPEREVDVVVDVVSEPTAEEPVR